MRSGAPATPFRDPGYFATTHWSVVLKATGVQSAEASDALNNLCRTYWYPLYSYVRRCGHSAEEAADLTQDFFTRFLQKGYVTHANPERGKFRSFLLTSMKNFLAGAHTRAMALKRGGEGTFVSLDDEEAENRFQAEPHTLAAPDQLFDRNWALAVMHGAMEQLEEECARAGKGPLFEALKPFLARESSNGEYERLAGTLTPPLTRNGVAVAVHRLRERYRDLVRSQVAQTVLEPAAVEEELRYLLLILAEVL